MSKTFAQVTRSNDHAAFGAPSEFKGDQLPTYLEVAKHFLWKFDELRHSKGTNIGYREVASVVKLSHGFSLHTDLTESSLLNITVVACC